MNRDAPSRSADRAKLRRIAVFALALSLTLVASCGGASGDSFSRGLGLADSIASQGDTGKSLNRLKRLRKKASSASQWLSIAKRERALGDSRAAVKTLQAGMRKLPTNPLLGAVLADTLNGLGEYDKAMAYHDLVSQTKYASVTALSMIRETSVTFPPIMDPGIWVVAYDATGNPACLRNAAVLYAAMGKMGEALAAADREYRVTGRDPYLCALIAYDASRFDASVSYLSVPLESLPDRDLFLLADAMSSLGKLDDARIVWQHCVAVAAGLSPVPWYNIALTEPDWAGQKQRLEECIRLFPSYYPSVARYARSVPRAATNDEKDFVEEELRSIGFLTLKMEAEMRSAPVEAERARQMLDAALAVSDDSRFLIEDLRFEQFENPDADRTAGRMWKLLERRSEDPLVRAYARWYFASIGNYDSAFSIKDKTPSDNPVAASEASFYLGLEAARLGDLAGAERHFQAVSNDAENSWCALANIARIRERREDYQGAADDLATAADLARDARAKSRLYAEAARLYIKLQSDDRARMLLGYAVELDPSNYAAIDFLRRFK